jgi:hypothetical protein
MGKHWPGAYCSLFDFNGRNRSVGFTAWQRCCGAIGSSEAENTMCESNILLKNNKKIDYQGARSFNHALTAGRALQRSVCRFGKVDAG